MNYTRPPLAIILDSIRNSFIDTKNRGIKLRYLTEITSENISYCKELLPIVDEIRHLDGIKGNFMISESEYLAPIILFGDGRVASQIMYSNQKETIDQHQYMFDTLWNKAIPAQQRIKEIEEGFEHPETRILKNKAEIFGYLKSIAENAYEQSTCCSIGGMQLVYNYFFNEYKKIAGRSRGRKKESNGVRWITSIDKDSIDLVKIFLDSEMQVRHVKNLTHVDFAVDNKNFNATIDKMEGGKLMETLLISNEPAYVSHYNSLFEELWRNGIDATERIRDIEAGVDLADIEVIPSSARAQERYLNAVRSAKEEILWIFPTVNAFIRQDKIGAIPLAKEKNIKIKILMPFHESIEDKIRKLKEEKNNNSTDNSRKKDVRYIEQMSETKATILVVDRKVSLVMELKDDTKSTFYEAIGLSTYSNSKAGVLSYVAIFENLWRQAELYQQVKTSNEQLGVHDKMQKEFINIAAHELRNPIQPIIGLSEVLRSRTKNIDDYEFLDVIIRSAKRLQQLTENILNVAQIENHSLKLNKERFNLTVLITNMLKDYRNQFEENKDNGKGSIKLLYKSRHGKGYDDNEDIIFVDADAGRIAQVISNLLNNAIKFTIGEVGGGKVGDKTITIIVDNKDDKTAVVRVEDTGSGIAREIFPRLFSKFVTNSDAGTGLGLFISRNIVEAHGGKIWAQNNPDGKGATFAFSLPVVNKQ